MDVAQKILTKNLKLHKMKTLKNTSWLCGILFLLGAFLLPSQAFAQEKDQEEAIDTANARVIELKGLNNMTFDKKEIVVKPGEVITIRLTTDTKYKPRQMSHNFVLLKQTVNIQQFVDASEKSAINDFIDPDREDQVIAHTAMAAGGETVEVTFKAPERPSKYMYLCTFPGHFFAGMRGTLSVQE